MSDHAFRPSVRDQLGFPLGRVLANGEVAQRSAMLDRGVTSYDDDGLVAGWTMIASVAAAQRAYLVSQGIQIEPWTADINWDAPWSGADLDALRDRQLAERAAHDARP